MTDEEMGGLVDLGLRCLEVQYARFMEDFTGLSVSPETEACISLRVAGAAFLPGQVASTMTGEGTDSFANPEELGWCGSLVAECG